MWNQYNSFEDWASLDSTTSGLFYRGSLPTISETPLKTNGRLANLELTSLVKEATDL